MGLYRQMIGRVLRPGDSKPDAIVLDHSGAVYRHGLPEDRVEWTLAVDRRAVNPAQAKRDCGEAPKLRECPSCKAIMVAPPCGAGGWQPQPRARAIDFAEGELGLVVGGKAQAARYTIDQKADWYRMLVGEVLRRGKKPGWAFYLFEDKFGHKPPQHWDRTALAPTPEVASFVRSRVIAYAKRRAA
jgi:superfamily II DNA or RNA helicase